MLTPHDDYPLHQTPEPLAQPFTSDRNFYDRYWFNGFARDGEFYFGIALGVYPNRRIMDASLSIVRDGEQHSLHASRLAPRDRTENRVGPLRIEVVEPMRRLRVHIDPNETGIECDLQFAARTAAIEEAPMILRRDQRVIMNTTRFTQFGTWQGSIRAAGQVTEVTAPRAYGVRDRSWGVRPVGEPEAGAPGSPPRIFFLWAPLHFDDICTHFGVFEEQDGTRWHEDGMIVPAYAAPDAIPDVEDPGIEHMVSLGHRLQYERGTRRAKAAEIELNTRSGERHVITLEPLLRFQMLGLGYVHPEWGHGVWKGEEALASESWKLDALDPLLPQHQHIQQVMRARMGKREGVGVLEQLCFGAHATYGFKELLDGAA
jgi:hypothetical protein